MKKNLTTLALCSFAFGLGFGMNNVTFGNATPAPVVKIAHVNTQKLLASSKSLKAAEKDKAKKTTEMLKWYDSIDSQIKAKTKEEEKIALIKKYEPELKKKKEAIRKDYATKIKAVDTQVSSAINQKAKDMGYTIVLKGDSVLFGGDDITSSVLPLVK